MKGYTCWCSQYGALSAPTSTSTTSVGDWLGSQSPITAGPSALSAIHPSPTYPLHLNFETFDFYKQNFEFENKPDLRLENDRSLLRAAC